jgi:hypothetical protein
LVQDFPNALLSIGESVGQSLKLGAQTEEIAPGYYIQLLVLQFSVLRGVNYLRHDLFPIVSAHTVPLPRTLLSTLSPPL